MYTSYTSQKFFLVKKQLTVKKKKTNNIKIKAFSLRSESNIIDIAHKLLSI